MSAFCPECNTPIEGNEKECPNCGALLADRTQGYELVDGILVPVNNAAKNHEGKVPRYYSLYITKGPQKDVRFDLLNSYYSIGRNPHCDIFLSHVTVSRKHAVIMINDGVMMVKDSGSTNGTWVNGSITSEAVLREGDILQIGAFVMTVEAQY